MTKNKLTAIFAFIIISFSYVISIFTYNYIKQNETVLDSSNPYFFKEGTTTVEYAGFFYTLNGREIKQNITLNIIHLKTFNDGVLYALELNQLDEPDSTDENDSLDPPDIILMGRQYLGYFYITNDTIYHMPLHNYEAGFADEENDKIINLIQQNREEFLVECVIVCAENGTDDIIFNNDWHNFVEVDGNRRIFRCYSDYISGTRQYTRIEWEKDNGIVYYISGEGSMLMHVEFGLELDIDNGIRYGRKIKD